MSTNQTPTPTEESEIERAKTMFVIPPAALPPASPTPSASFNYDHYFKVRDREAAEMNLRRERQLEILKWASLFLSAAIAAVPNIVPKLPVGVLEIQCRAVLAIIVLFVCFYASKRIRHDAKLAHFRAKICHAMDEGVGYQFDDRMLKDGGLTYGQADVFRWFLILLSLVVCLELVAIPLNKPVSDDATKLNQQMSVDVRITAPDTEVR